MPSFPIHRKDDPPAPTPTATTTSTLVNGSSNNTRSYPTSPLTHVFILTSVLTPIALIPYLAVRRHLLSLHKQISKIHDTNIILRRDLKTALLEASIRRDEHEGVRVVLEGTKRELEGLKRVMERSDVVRSEEEGRVRRDLRELLEEKQRTRLQLSTLRELGKSLADVAAFMHEVEVQQGFVSRPNDGRGIERIRQLAYKLEGLHSEVKDTKINTSKSSSKDKS